MIQRLHNKEIETSKKIYSVFQASYKVEAKLLNATDFPPLKRPLEKYVNSKTDFFGYFKGPELAGIIEIKQTPSDTHIHSLVVDPLFFRQGVAKNLLEYMFKTVDSPLFVVETGLQNSPAMTLYKGFGFVEVQQYVSHGIMKVRFEREAMKNL